MNVRHYYSSMKPLISSVCVNEQERQNSLRELDGAQEALNRLYEAFDVEGLGLTLKGGAGMWAVVLPDASTPGMYRYQSFTSNGWGVHCTLPKVDEVILAAFAAGYREIAPRGTLDVVSSAPEWQRAMAAGEIIRSLQAGRLSRGSSLQALKAIASG